jgi:hypothetical protein
MSRTGVELLNSVFECSTTVRTTHRLLLLLLLNRPLLPSGVEGSAEPSPSTSNLCHNRRFSPVNSSSYSFVPPTPV